MTTVLVAEDDDALRSLVVLILRREGLDVSAVEDGARAVDSVLAQCPDLVVLDGQMPKLTGQQVCERLRASAEVANVPILMLSGSMEPADDYLSRHAGATAYLQKPFTSDELVRLVRALVGPSKAAPTDS
ncbi:MAG: response regulator with CheY-like receiver domain and winged-helix DNA-binding domain [Acidimicrobiia bacterium]|nr:response regulator with CheY-like receiver domain and winged-helix DNA-binding domain [Acidimicrobiia bacterium]